MVYREQLRPGDLVDLTHAYMVGHKSTGQEILIPHGSRLFVVAVESGPDAKALVLDDNIKLHTLAAWWIEVNSELVGRTI